MIFAGAALGPLLAGLISPTGWNNVFYMLISADILACLVRNNTTIALIYKKSLNSSGLNSVFWLLSVVMMTTCNCLLHTNWIVANFLLFFFPSFWPDLSLRKSKAGVDGFPEPQGESLTWLVLNIEPPKKIRIIRRQFFSCIYNIFPLIPPISYTLSIFKHKYISNKITWLWVAL